MLIPISHQISSVKYGENVENFNPRLSGQYTPHNADLHFSGTWICWNTKFLVGQYGTDLPISSLTFELNWHLTHILYEMDCMHSWKIFQFPKQSVTPKKSSTVKQIKHGSMLQVWWPSTIIKLMATDKSVERYHG